MPMLYTIKNRLAQGYNAVSQGTTAVISGAVTFGKGVAKVLSPIPSSRVATAASVAAAFVGKSAGTTYGPSMATKGLVWGFTKAFGPYIGSTASKVMAHATAMAVVPQIAPYIPVATAVVGAYGATVVANNVMRAVVPEHKYSNEPLEVENFHMMLDKAQVNSYKRTMKVVNEIETKVSRANSKLEQIAIESDWTDLADSKI